jgi:AraC family transcriptional activator of pobA
MKSKVKSLNPNQFLNEFMISGSKRDEIFKSDFGNFYIARMEDLTEITKPPVPPVRAETHTFFFLTKGVLIMKVGLNAVRAKKNECVMIPAGQVFSYDNEEKEQAYGFICGFSNDFLVGLIGNSRLLKRFEFLTVWGNPVLQPEKKITKFLIQSFQRILYEYLHNGLKNELILKSHLIAALCDLNVNYQPLSKSNNHSAIELTNKFKDLLHRNLRSNHKVAEYASMLHVTPNHLNKHVKLITGKTPSEWVSESLVIEAKTLLYQSGQSISEIATEIGIDDTSYFSRLFKKHEGMSPIAYRKMIESS